MDYADFLTGVYRDQLGRAPDESGLAWYVDQLTSGQKTPDQVLREINQSPEGQNFDTQLITSEYRTELGRNPEQEGYQYWMSRMQTDPTLAAANIQSFIRGGVSGSDLQALGAPNQYIDLMMNALEADPYAGRYATDNIYRIAADTPNVSTFGDYRAQFVSPVTLQPVISSYDPQTGQFTTTAGADILDENRIANAIKVATNSGALSLRDAQTLMNDLSTSTTMEDTYAALSRPQAGVVVDRLFGLQLGEDANIEKARAEAINRMKAIPKVDYTPSYLMFGDEMVKQNIVNPFAPNVFTARSMVGPGTDLVVGSTGSLAVTATGSAPLTFQWRKFGQPILCWLQLCAGKRPARVLFRAWLGDWVYPVWRRKRPAVPIRRIWLHPERPHWIPVWRTRG